MTDQIGKTNRRTLIASAAAISATLLFASASGAFARSLEEARNSGYITVGIQGDNSPFGFVNSSGQQDGFDSYVARAFGEWLGVEVRFMPLAVANRIPALQTDRVDVLFATMAMTEERARSIQYSVPYAGNVISVVAPIDRAIETPEDLNGVRIGVPRSSTQDQALTSVAPSGASIFRFDDDAATIQALVSGQVEAVGANQFYNQRLEAVRPGTYESKFPLTITYNGAGSRLGERDWNEALNAFLDEYMQTPEYLALYQQWMEIDPPEFPESIPNIPFTVPN